MYIKYWILNVCDVCIIFHSILVDNTSSVCNVWKTFQTKWRLIRWIELSACHFSACIQKFCQFNSEMSLKRMKESKELNFSLSSLSKGMFARILSVWSVFVPLGNCSSGLFCQKVPCWLWPPALLSIPLVWMHTACVLHAVLHFLPPVCSAPVFNLAFFVTWLICGGRVVTYYLEIKFLIYIYIYI